uniref:Uncharacterized protein n=1 Tax=Candidatus Kentrum sp. FM TaxID=2126340 RepID=A0A450SEJ1_9GAMM|nr:MAG: hypothetical protein BECKFM1743A_GA0114220_100914 [Candidatus Kentron sp. FM]
MGIPAEFMGYDPMPESILRVREIEYPDSSAPIKLHDHRGNAADLLGYFGYKATRDETCPPPLIMR